MSEKITVSHEHDIYIAIDGNDDDSMWLIIAKRWKEPDYLGGEYTVERELAKVEVNKPVLDGLIKLFTEFRNRLDLMGI